jgi:hypothetical protein
MSDQARQNRAHLRRLLEEKEPELAAVFRIVERELTASMSGPRNPGQPGQYSTGDTDLMSDGISSV